MKKGISTKSIQIKLAHLQLNEPENKLFTEKIILVPTKEVLKKEYFRKLTDLMS